MLYKIAFWVLFAVVIILVIQLILMKHILKSISSYLESISKNSHKKLHNKIITISFIDRDIERLAAGINSVTAYYNKKMHDIQLSEQELKNQIYNISHDLRTPLTSISGYLQLLETIEVSNPDAKKYIQIVYEKSKYLNKLMNEFFELSIIESDNYQIVLELFDIVEKLNTVIVSNYAQIKSHKIEPVIEIEKEQIFIESDAIICERIIQNIILNAIKYTRKGIYIHMAENEIHRPVLLVQNESNPFSDYDLEHLCDRFYKTDKSRSASSTGLGLYIVKSLLEQIHGYMQLSYKDGMFNIEVTF